MNKKLFKSIREYKKESILAPILVILEVLMEVLIPLEMAKIIDIGIAGGVGVGLLIKDGEIVKKVPEDQLLDTLREELLHWNEIHA